MADRIQKNREPSKSPHWPLEAAKKRSGPPSKALLDRLRYAREHPEEIARKLQNDAVRSGRDPDAFGKVMAEMRRNARPVRIAQRPKDVQPAVMADDIEVAVEDQSPMEAEEGVQTHKLSSAAVSIPTNPVPTGRSAGWHQENAPQRIERLPLSSAFGQSRVGAKGQITKPQNPENRNERTTNKDKVRKRKTKSGATSSASGTASPPNVDSPQPLAESSASGAIREALDSTSRMPENHDSSITPPHAQPYPFPSRPIMPTWYATVSRQSQALLERRRPQEITAIDALKACIRRCEKEKAADRLAKEHIDLRDHIHKAEIKLDMDKTKVKITRILTETGLPSIFNEHANFPWDLKADAWNLYERWMNEDFDRDILRGIVTVKGDSRSGDRLDPAYKKKHPKDPKTFGDNGAVLGQWWPSQLCAVRDGIHGAPQAGIYGDKERGAYSIVLSSGGYHDRDDGDVIEYSGTEGSNFEIKAATQSLIISAKLGNHIRVLRSSQLPKSNKHRPSCGLRYDGLYQIKSYQEIDLEKQTYRFRLERIPGQQPIRSQGVTKRPTVFEEEAYQRCKGRI